MKNNAKNADWTIYLDGILEGIVRGLIIIAPAAIVLFLHIFCQ